MNSRSWRHSSWKKLLTVIRNVSQNGVHSSNAATHLQGCRRADRDSRELVQVVFVCHHVFMSNKIWSVAFAKNNSIRSLIMSIRKISFAASESTLIPFSQLTSPPCETNTCNPITTETPTRSTSSSKSRLFWLPPVLPGKLLGNLCWNSWWYVKEVAYYHVKVNKFVERIVCYCNQ